MVLCEKARERAYYIWEGEGRVFGRAEAHWLQAESELLQAPAAALIEAEASAAPAKVAKPRTARAKASVQAPPRLWRASPRLPGPRHRLRRLPRPPRRPPRSLPPRR